MPYSLRSTKPQHNLSSHTDSTGVSHMQTSDSHSTTNSAQGFSTVMSFVNDLTAALLHPDVLHAFGVLIGTKASEALSDYEDRIRNCEAKLSVKDKKIEELEAQLQECSLRTDKHKNVLDDHEQYSRMCSIRIQHLEWAEKEAEDCTALVCDYAKTNNIDLSPTDIDACHRMGKKTNTTRPILVKLVRRSHRTELLKTKTTQRLAKSKIYINEDYTTRTIDHPACNGSKDHEKADCRQNY